PGPHAGPIDGRRRDVGRPSGRRLSGPGRAAATPLGRPHRRSLLARLVTTPAPRRHHTGTTPASRRGRRSAANGLWLRDPGRLMRRLRRICLIALGALVGLYIVAT